MILPHLTYEQKILGSAAMATTVLVFGSEPIAFLLEKIRGLMFSGRLKSANSIRIGEAVISDEARLRHTHIVGATGSGKTVLLEQLIYRDLERGYGAVIIDPKGDRELFERVQAFCRKIGREADLKLLSATHLSETCAWNPCRLGNPIELQTKFLNSAIYSEPHYEKACELGLLKAFNHLQSNCEDGFDVRDLVESLFEEKKENKNEATEGLFLDLNNLSLGPWAEILTGGSSVHQEEIDLLKIIRSNEILFVDLPTESQAVQSARIGRLLLQEIILVSGMRKLYPHLRSGRPFSIFVDEFDAFAFPAFTTFLNKGRSSDFMIHLAHQTLSDLDRINESFKGQVMGNMNVRFIFRQDNPDDAETWSRLFGTHRSIKKTYQTQDGSKTGMSSNREVLEFRVAPDSIKDLKTGECFFGIKSDGRFSKLKVPFGRGAFEPSLPVPTLRNQTDLKRLRPVPPQVEITKLAEELGDPISANKTDRGGNRNEIPIRAFAGDDSDRM